MTFLNLLLFENNQEFELYFVVVVVVVVVVVAVELLEEA